MDPDFGTLTPPNYVPWLLTQWSCDNIDNNYSNLDAENISHTMCWTDEFEATNKPKPWCRLGGFRMEAFKKSIVKKTVSWWMLMGMDPLLKLLYRTRLSFFKRRDEGRTTFKKHHLDKSHYMTSMGFIILYLHMIWIIEHCCIEMKTSVQNTKLDLCFHHIGWYIVLQADTTPMGKWCDPLKFGMTTYIFQWVLPDSMR